MVSRLHRGLDWCHESLLGPDRGKVQLAGRLVEGMIAAVDKQVAEGSSAVEDSPVVNKRAVENIRARELAVAVVHILAVECTPAEAVPDMG